MQSRVRRTAFCATLLVTVAGMAKPAQAQCADGSAPPCATRQTLRPVDRGRVAVLPFRVTTADSLLGEGFAELLAPEFTGEGGPRAVDMSTMINAWRGAGGALRSPLSEDAAARVARGVGAGLFVQGSIVGFGNRLTVIAGLYDATTGRPIAASTRTSATPDSVDVLLRQTATGLLGAAGATTRAREVAALTSSPAALRSYLEGMALWRRGNWTVAEKALGEAFSADTLFAPAAYRLWLLTSQFGRGAPWAQRTIALKARLNESDRAIVSAFLEAPATRSLAETIAARRQTAERLVDSPDAWFLYGDFVYHSGHAVFGPDSAIAIARAAFRRAVSVDRQPVFLYHVTESAVIARDTAELRQIRTGYEALAGEERWPRLWLIASVLKDTSLLSQLRRIDPGTTSTISATALYTFLPAVVPATRIDEGFRILKRGMRDEALAHARVYEWVVQRARGRPAAAERALDGSTPNIFDIPYVGYVWLSGHPDVDAEILGRLGNTPLEAAPERRRQCVRGYVHVAHGRLDSAALGTIDQRATPRCAALLRSWAAVTQGNNDSAFAVLDSLSTYFTYGTFYGFENRVVARILEARGDTAGAFRAIRRYPRDYMGMWYGPTLLEEGRLALAVRDTSAATRAYQRYLDLRSEPETPFVAERDSVRAFMARLRRR